MQYAAYTQHACTVALLCSEPGQGALAACGGVEGNAGVDQRRGWYASSCMRIIHCAFRGCRRQPVCLHCVQRIAEHGRARVHSCACRDNNNVTQRCSADARPVHRDSAGRRVCRRARLGAAQAGRAGRRAANSTLHAVLRTVRGALHVAHRFAAPSVRPQPSAYS